MRRNLGEFRIALAARVRLATTAVAWEVPCPAGAIFLIDLGTLPAITIIAPGA
jgi:hypothetical protein